MKIKLKREAERKLKMTITTEIGNSRGKCLKQLLLGLTRWGKRGCLQKSRASQKPKVMLEWVVSQWVGKWGYEVGEISEFKKHTCTKATQIIRICELYLDLINITSIKEQNISSIPNLEIVPPSKYYLLSPVMFLEGCYKIMPCTR